MLNHRASSIHQIIGQMIRGDLDDESNWQMVEYVFDKLKSEGCGFGMRFYNTLLEALWWLGQRERASRVLHEATKRGLFPELIRKNKLVWSVNIHRYHYSSPYFFRFPVLVSEYVSYFELLDLKNVAWKRVRCIICLD